MQSTQLKALDTGRRVQGFLDTQASVVGDVVPATLRARLDAAVTKLASFRAEQGAMDEAAQGESERQDALRNIVYKRFLLPITRIARLVRSETPDFPSLAVPAHKKRASDFVERAETITDAAAKYYQAFVNNGLPADFAAQVKAIIGQINGSADARGRYLARRFAATKGLKAAEKSIRDTIGVLDGVIAPLLEGDPSLLGDWIASKRIHQTGVTPLVGGDTVVNTEAEEPESPAPLTLSAA